ncbi:hypothetical protein RJT34_00727 [Clitoria ternatea]|uniref:Uncharacterized protein n=1 Tax=Clitoria ternatea TaxID=43366 RepID=A0AAN9KFL0_CLITE
MEKESGEEKRARVEKRIRGILFMEMDGELMGIDLNQHQSWDYKDHIFQDKVDDYPLSIEMCPVVCYYVVDDKLLVLCNDNLMYAFSHSSKQWEVIALDVNLFRVHGRRFPSLCTGLWLPEQQIALAIDCPMLSPPGEPCLFQADAIIYSPDGVPEFHQVLEEVFSDMYPHDSKYPTCATTHLLHLGQGSQEDQSRICAVMYTAISTEWTIDHEMGEQEHVCLFISIFELQRLHPSDHVSTNSCQLLKMDWVLEISHNLEVFKMEGINVSRWTLEKGAVPRLRHFVIGRCKYLDELPEQLWCFTTSLQVHVLQPNSALAESL